MADRILMLEKLSTVFDEGQAQVLAEVIYNSYNDLVRREDFSELKEIVRDLGATQQRTEQRVEELAEAQQRTEQRVEELAEAQQRTETTVQSLAREVGGLSNRLGGDLEDVAAIVIEDTLKRELGWEVEELSRVWHPRDGVDEEIDAFGRAHDPSRPQIPLWIVGEVKFNLTMRDVARFSRLVERAAAHLEGQVVPVCFCYRIRPAVQENVLEKGYRLVLSNGRMPQAGNESRANFMP